MNPSRDVFLRLSAGRAPFLPCILCLLLCACAEESEPPAFVPVADARQLMLSVIEPAAEIYWDAVGVIMDTVATHKIEPRTDEEWEAVLNAAYIVAESGNLLLMEARAEGQSHWTAMSRAMIDVGRGAVGAAERRDPDAVFEAGGDIYQVCTGCHAVYATETLRPNYLADSIPADAMSADSILP